MSSVNSIASDKLARLIGTPKCSALLDVRTDDDFSVEAPVEIQFAKGPPQTIWVETSSTATIFSATLKEVPTKVSIPAGRGVLALKK